MRINKSLLILTVVSAFIAAQPLGATADAKPKRYDRHFAKKPYYAPLRRAADGALVDRRGWRLRPAWGWDNTCFNLDYLASQYACSNGRR